MITDTHAHLFWRDFDEDRGEVLARARAAGVERMIIVGTDLETSRASFALCEGEPGLYATAGVHPHDADAASPENLAQIEELCRREDCVAVGETGLDYFKEYAPKQEQRRAFRWHLDLARRLDKPVIVHCRDAHRDTSELIAEAPGVRGVMHCFTMGAAELGPYLERDFYVSFSGVVTFPRKRGQPRGGARGPARSPAGRDRLPLPRPAGQARQAQRARARAARARARGGSARPPQRGARGDHERERGATVRVGVARGRRGLEG